MFHFTTNPGKYVHNELIHFVECLETGQRPSTDGVRSLQSLRVIWQLYEAEQQGVVADLRGLGILAATQPGIMTVAGHVRCTTYAFAALHSPSLLFFAIVLTTKLGTNI